MRRHPITPRRSLTAVPLHRLLLLAVGLVVLLPALPAQADIGPKPSMSFTFEYQIPRVAITSGQMLECENADCRAGKPLEQLGPQGFRCADYDCGALAYGFADYHKLVITFADGVTRESNIFAKSGRGGDFTVTVTGEALKVEAKRGLGNLLCCVPSWALTLVVETLIAGLYMSAFQLPRALLGVAPLASLFSLPVVWFAFPQLALPWLAVVGLAELFAVVFETGFVYAFTHWTMPLRHAAILSLLMNAASFGLGFLGNLPL
jgi:hypothetical protein